MNAGADRDRRAGQGISTASMRGTRGVHLSSARSVQPAQTPGSPSPRETGTITRSGTDQFRVRWNDGGMLLEQERRQVVAYCRRLRPDRLVVATSGNVSVRSGDLVAVTPSGVDYDELAPEQVGVHQLDGAPVEAPLEPTTELPMHLAVYGKTGALAIVHTHSTAATAVSTLVDELPPIHYLIALFGGPVRVAPYATYGTDDLAAGVVRALADRTACLLGNHGAVTVGDTIGRAYTNAVYLEWLCEVWLAASAHGQPQLLPPEEIARVWHKIAGYGRTQRPD
jgi:L-fuculose-phosphate aldolase